MWRLKRLLYDVCMNSCSSAINDFIFDMYCKILSIVALLLDARGASSAPYLVCMRRNAFLPSGSINALMACQFPRKASLSAYWSCCARRGRSLPLSWSGGDATGNRGAQVVRRLPAGLHGGKNRFRIGTTRMRRFKQAPGPGRATAAAAVQHHLSRFGGQGLGQCRHRAVGYGARRDRNKSESHVMTARGIAHFHGAWLIRAFAVGTQRDNARGPGAFKSAS